MSLVGVTYAGGMGALNEASDQERLANAERAVDVLDTNLESLSAGTAPTRSTRMRLHDARLGLGDPVHISLSVNDATVYTRSVEPVYYANPSAETRLVASNGAVFRQQPEGTALLSKPAFVVGDRTVIPIVDTKGDPQERAGDGRFTIRTTVADRTVERFTTAGDTVELRVDSPRADAWARYLTEETGHECEESGGVATCQLTTSDVSIQTVVIDVTIE